MKKTFLTVVVLLLAWSNVDLKAQETITNAFDDLKRTGTVNEQDSEMRQAIFVLLKIGCMISVLIKSFRPVGRNAFSTLGYN